MQSLKGTCQRTSERTNKFKVEPWGTKETTLAAVAVGAQNFWGAANK